MTIEYAIMLDLPLSPTTDADVGLYDSSFCWITGPGYDGDNPPENPPPNPTTSSPQMIWKSGILGKDGIGPISQTADPSDGGFYATVGGTRVTVRNLVPGSTTPFSEYLRANGINIQRCRARLFIVFDGEFQQAREFMVDRYAHNDAAITFDLRDIWYVVHRDIVLGRVTRSRFPLAPEGSIDQVLPLCIGDIPRAKLLPLSSQREPVQVVGDAFGGGGVTRVEFGAAIDALTGTSNSVRLTTNGISPAFTSNDSRLVGAFFAVVINGIDGSPLFAQKIKGNAATVDTGGGTSRTDLFLDGRITNDAGDVVSSAAPAYGIVYEQTNFQAVAEAAIKEIGASLFGWDDDKKTFISLAERIVSRFPAADYALIPGVAGVVLLPDGRNEFEAPLPMRIHVPFTDVKFLSRPVGGGYSISGGLNAPTFIDSFPSDNSPAPLINDKLISTKYERKFRFSVASNGTGIFELNPASGTFPNRRILELFKFKVPEGLKLSSTDKLVVCMDLDFLLSSKGSGTAEYGAVVYIDLLDHTGAPIPGISGSSSAYVPLKNKDGTNLAVSGLTPGASGQTYAYRGLSSSFYTDAGGAENGFAFNNLDITGNVVKFIATGVELSKIASLRIGLGPHFKCTYQGAVAGEVYDVGYSIRQIAVFRQIENYGGDYYAPLTGVKFGDTWGGRRSTSDAVATVSDAIEYFIRERDGAPEAVDTESFDTAARDSSIWQVGRQVNEERSSLDYIRELLKAGFFCIVPGVDGKRVLRRIDGHPETARLLSEADIIKGSLGAAELIDVDRAYTSVDFSYHYNPASDKYESRIAVFHEEEDEFPASDEMENGAPIWQSWVIGVSSYGNAKHLWELAHAAWLVTRRKKVAKLELLWVNRNEAEHFDLPYFLAMLYLEWLGVPKERVKLRLPLTPENAQILLMDSFRLQDQKRTGGSWFWNKVDNIVIDTTKDEVELSLYRRVTEEANAPEQVLIEESLDAEDVIQEGLTETETIEEVL